MRLALLTLVSLACTVASPSAVTVDHFRGVYSTHFEGIPDQTGICAVISNRGREPVNWIRLRLRSWGDTGQKPGRWKSRWLYEGQLMPGQSVAVEFDNAPNSAQIEISVDRAGSGARVPSGRPLRRVSACSEASLARTLLRINAGREAQNVQMLPIVRRNHPDIEVKVASN